MVRDAFERRSPAVDRSRVYAAGVSSGAMMTVILAATYPELFTAIAVDSGCAYRARTCIGARPSRSSRTLAREALRALGPRTRAVPVLIIHGDRDRTVPFEHSRQVLAQWRMTDNLVLSGTSRAPIRATPTTTEQIETADGRTATVERYTARGRTIIERWTIHGLEHCWSRGVADRIHPSSDGRAPPDACDAVWSFFRRVSA